MKGEVKSQTVDRYLRPIRKQIKELIAHDSTIIDFGCGNGELLFQLSDKITSGIGVDNSESLIHYALNKKKEEGFENLSFQKIDLSVDFTENHADYAIASLFFHVIPHEKAIQLVNKMMGISKTMMICAFSKPENWRQNILLWIDQRFTGHYQNFKDYQKQGYMLGVLEKIESINYECFDTFDPVIKIYKITK